MAYMDYPLTEIAQAWIKNGGQASDLIEPVDGIFFTSGFLLYLSLTIYRFYFVGFHPGQLMNYLMVSTQFHLPPFMDIAQLQFFFFNLTNLLFCCCGCMSG